MSRKAAAIAIDPALGFRERTCALLYNARWARQALELANRFGL
jgi:hypothetical protein